MKRVGNYVTKHGLTGTVEHNIWLGIRRRCFSKTDHLYRFYGGRHIRICYRWNDFRNFLADMGSRPSPAYSVDRINNYGDYEPNNCRWATATQQMRNRRGLRMLTWNGETMCVTAWAERLGLNLNTVRRRLLDNPDPAHVLRPCQRIRS